MKTRKRTARRVVVKIGTGLLNCAPRIVRALVARRELGTEFILVTSGAIGMGIKPLGLDRRPASLELLQAAASVGQVHLMEHYARILGKNTAAGQILVTHEDFRHRRRYLNVASTIEALLARGVVPIVNENDTVSSDEIRIGDNDTLSAMIANLANADLLVVLSDVDGFYMKKPGPLPGSSFKVLKKVTHITQAMWRAAGGRGSDVSTGGMKTKLKAAQMMMNAGVDMVIANAGRRNVINRILDGRDEGTRFIGAKKTVSGKKRWIATAALPAGEVMIDDGAVMAIRKKEASLLPSGITNVAGIFEKGDILRILDSNGNELARGISKFNAAQLSSIAGRRSDEIKRRMPGAHTGEAVNRNDMVWTMQE